MCKWTLFAASLVIAANCAAAPSATEQGAHLIAQLKAASGGAALDTPTGFHEVGAGTRDGANMTYETWGDLKSLKSASTRVVDGHIIAGGFDGQAAWMAGPDGKVHIDTSPDGVASARLGTYLTIGGYFYPDRFPARFEYSGRKKADGKSFDVVTATPEGATPVDLWLDRSTHRLQRVSGTDGKTAFAGVVGRYQVVDGAWIGFGLTVTEGAHKTVLNLTSFAFEPVPAERFAPPAAH
jgi:hypothetical protein